MLTTIIIVSVFIGVATLVGGVALLVRGSAASPVEERLNVLTGASASLRPDAEERPSLLAQPLDMKPDTLESLLPSSLNLRVFLEQADASLPPGKFLLITLGLVGIGGVLSALAGIPLATAPLAGLALGTLPSLWLMFKRKKRLSTFAKQLPDALELMSRALRAGHSLASGINLVAQEMPQPIGKEFARCYEEQNLGIPLEDAMENLTERVPNLDLRFFATAIILQRQTGGDLAEILDKIGYLVRERFKIYGQVQALTGEGRLSGVVLLGLPPVLMLAMYRLNPEYIMVLFEEPLGHKMLAVAAVLQIIGALVIRKIVNIKV